MKAEIQHIAGYLPFDLEGLDSQRNKKYILHCINKEFILTNEEGLNPVIFLEDCTPIMHPLSSLIKEIEFEGKKIRPMFELLKLVSNQETIPSETIEYSEDNGAYFVRVNYKGFYVILAYDSQDDSFRMIRNDKIVSINNQLKAFQMLYKWHFNIHKVESIDK